MARELFGTHMLGMTVRIKDIKEAQARIIADMTDSERLDVARSLLCKLVENGCTENYEPQDGVDYTAFCFYCSANIGYDNHADDCLFVRTNEFLSETMERV